MKNNNNRKLKISWKLKKQDKLFIRSQSSQLNKNIKSIVQLNAFRKPKKEWFWLKKFRKIFQFSTFSHLRCYDLNCQENRTLLQNHIITKYAQY